MPGWFTALRERLSVDVLYDALREIRLSDVADMAIVSLFIYVAILGLTSRRAARVARGVLVVGCIYAVARYFDMALTLTLFRSLFTVFLISLVIVFQEDLRLFFERLTVWGWRDPSDPRHEELVQALVRAVTVFARDHIGALIVLKGMDPIERHLRGGQTLGGEVSGALLESLFDPHSSGHDGAVIIEDGRITRFGVHLPLSQRRDGIEGRGTRHAAALGLAELVDAFCIVVSEENGAFSAAHNGAIVELPSRKSLESALGIFLKQTSPGARRATRWIALFQHWRLKLIAASAGLVLWLMFVQGLKPVHQDFTVPVQASDVPDRLRVKTISPTHVTVRVTGLSREMSRLKPPLVSVSLAVASAGPTRVLLSENDVRLRGPAHLVAIEPSAVEIELVKIIPAAVPPAKPHRPAVKPKKTWLW